MTPALETVNGVNATDLPIAMTEAQPPAKKTPSEPCPCSELAAFAHEPTPLLWGDGTDGSYWESDTACERLTAVEFGPLGLLSYGHFTSSEFRLDVLIRQAIWTGSVGVFFGHRGRGKHRRFQTISLEPANPTYTVFQIQRSLRTSAGAQGLGSENGLKVGPGYQHLVVRSGKNGLIEVLFNGQRLSQVVTPTGNASCVDEDYLHDFGIYQRAPMATYRLLRVFKGGYVQEMKVASVDPTALPVPGSGNYMNIWTPSGPIFTGGANYVAANGETAYDDDPTISPTKVLCQVLDTSARPATDPTGPGGGVVEIDPPFAPSLTNRWAWATNQVPLTAGNGQKYMHAWAYFTTSAGTSTAWASQAFTTS